MGPSSGRARLNGGRVGDDIDGEFADFVAQWSPALLRVAFLLTGDHGLAEDLLQTALMKTSRHWRRMTDRDMAYGYVRRVLVTTHTSWHRHRRVPEVLVDRLTDDVAPAGTAHESAALGQALAALEQLPPRVRAVIVLRFYEDLSEADTADALGCSIGSVKSQASRGLARLRHLMTHPTLAPTSREASR